MISPLNIAVAVLLGIIIICILAGNSLVICAFTLGSRRMKTYTNYFIVNLAISDLLVGILSGPYWIYIATLPRHESTRTFPEYKAFQALDILLGSISILNLVSLTFERLIAVKWPAYHFNLTWKPVAVVLGMTWVLGIIIAGLGFLGIKQEYYFYFLFSIDFAFPTLLVCGCYLVIFEVARESSTLTNRRVKKDMKIARMILIIIGLFLLCWLPFFTINIIYYNCSTWCDQIPTSLIDIFKLLHYSNSMMNFFVYAVRSPDFRRSFTALIQWKIPRFRSDTLTSMRLRQRTFSNPSNSYENHRSNGNLANNETLNTPLPQRSHTELVNLTTV